ncbi:biotin transporter BioY [Breznakiellaceae bacterium SP9]
MEYNSVSTRRKPLVGIVLTSLFAGLIAAGSFIAIPLPLSPVPIVLNNFFALLSGLLLGPFYGAAAVLLYLAAGIIGAPVFAGGTGGGIAHFAGPTGGFLAGYLLAALCAGFIARRPRIGKTTGIVRLCIASALGILILYVPGLIWFKITLDASWEKTLALAFIPFLIGDGIKAVIAVPIAMRLRRAAAVVLA